jgi:hypothetical protein
MGKDDVPGILMECIGDTVGYIIHNMTSGSASNDGKPQGAISMGK